MPRAVEPPRRCSRRCGGARRPPGRKRRPAPGPAGTRSLIENSSTLRRRHIARRRVPADNETVIFRQFYLNCLAHASYLVGDEDTRIAAVVDPQRDVERYLDEAGRHGL